MKRGKVGLHKEVSSIFDGVPIWCRGGGALSLSGGSGPAEGGSVTSGPAAGQPGQGAAASGKSVVAKPPGAVTAKASGQAGWKKGWRKMKKKLLGAKGGAVGARQKVMAMLVPVLFMAFIFVLMPYFKRPSRKIAEARGAEAKKGSVEVIDKIDWEIPDPYPAVFRDPMEGHPVGAKPGAETTIIGKAMKLVVKGIIHSKDRPAAVIGTKIVHEGDTISGAKVLKIYPDSVEFEMNNRKWTQKVEP